MVSQNSPAALQWQMQNIRGSLSEHADEAVKKARREFDWRHYVAKHPWMSLGAAAAVGFFLVPRRACCKAGNPEAVNRRRRPGRTSGAALALCRHRGGVLSAVTATIAPQGSDVREALLAVRQLLDRNGRAVGKESWQQDIRCTGILAVDARCCHACLQRQDRERNDQPLIGNRSIGNSTKPRTWLLHIQAPGCYLPRFSECSWEFG